MNTRLRRMVGHGAIVMIFGLLAGFGLTMSLIGGFEIFPGKLIEFDLPADSRAWARAHAGGLMNGLLVMVVALLIHVMRLPEKTSARLYWMLVGTGYANTIFYWAGFFAPNRALTFGDNRLGETNIAGLIGLFPALVFAFVTTVAMFILVKHAFSSAEQND